MGVNAMSLSTEYMGLKLKNPIVVAAGPWSRDGASIQRSIDAGASAVVTETITLEANQNPSPPAVPKRQRAAIQHNAVFRHSPGAVGAGI